jgi:hypothetical protein
MFFLLHILIKTIKIEHSTLIININEKIIGLIYEIFDHEITTKQQIRNEILME